MNLTSIAKITPHISPTGILIPEFNPLSTVSTTLLLVSSIEMCTYVRTYVLVIQFFSSSVNNLNLNSLALHQHRWIRWRAPPPPPSPLSSHASIKTRIAFKKTKIQKTPTLRRERHARHTRPPPTCMTNARCRLSVDCSEQSPRLVPNPSPRFLVPLPAATEGPAAPAYSPPATKPLRSRGNGRTKNVVRST